MYQEAVARELDNVSNSLIEITRNLRESNIINLHGVVIGLRLLELASILADLDGDVSAFFAAGDTRGNAAETEAENAELTAVVE